MERTKGEVEIVGATRLWITGENGAALFIVCEPECKDSSDFHEVRIGSPRWREAMDSEKYLESQGWVNELHAWYHLFLTDNGLTTDEAMVVQLLAEKQALTARVDELEAALAMVKDTIISTELFCPACYRQHIDRGEWATKPHRKHLCEYCQTEWRPFPVATVGVLAASSLAIAKAVRARAAMWNARHTVESDRSYFGRYLEAEAIADIISRLDLAEIVAGGDLFSGIVAALKDANEIHLNLDTNVVEIIFNTQGEAHAMNAALIAALDDSRPVAEPGDGGE